MQLEPIVFLIYALFSLFIAILSIYRIFKTRFTRLKIGMGIVAAVALGSGIDSFRFVLSGFGGPSFAMQAGMFYFTWFLVMMHNVLTSALYMLPAFYIRYSKLARADRSVCVIVGLMVGF